MTTGFHGKLPARGDFVGAGLDRAWVAALDTCVSAGMAEAMARSGDDWTGIWLAAPVWRFALAEPAALGVWIPSVDRVGRFYPLMIVAMLPGAVPDAMARHGGGWLDAAEDAGRAALADDLAPEALRAGIPPAPDLEASPDAGLPPGVAPRPGASLWWTEGAPRVPAHGLVLDALPDPATFAAMLGAGQAAA
jgi:type VI secretion system protein ImpM